MSNPPKSFHRETFDEEQLVTWKSSWKTGTKISNAKDTKAIVVTKPMLSSKKSEYRIWIGWSALEQSWSARARRLQYIDHTGNIIVIVQGVQKLNCLRDQEILCLLDVVLHSIHSVNANYRQFFDEGLHGFLLPAFLILQFGLRFNFLTLPTKLWAKRRHTFFLTSEPLLRGKRKIAWRHFIFRSRKKTPYRSFLFHDYTTFDGLNPSALCMRMR